MKWELNRRLSKLKPRLSVALSEYAFAGVTVLRRQSCHLVPGFSFQPTAISPDQRWLECFVMPLFVPLEFVWLTWGIRCRIPHIEGRPLGPVVVSGDDEVGINNTIAAMVGQGRDFHNQFSDIHGFMELVLNRQKYWWAGRPLEDAEEAAYGAILADFEKEKVLELFDIFYNANRETDLKYRQDEVLRSEDLRRIYESRGPKSAKEKLYEFEEFTVKAIGLEEIWEPDYR